MRMRSEDEIEAVTKTVERYKGFKAQPTEDSMKPHGLAELVRNYEKHLGRPLVAQDLNELLIGASMVTRVRAESRRLSGI